ncbi:TetR/AcrR family transcriptional regulator [Cytobacillus horneckiae]|uniref:TetR/AcrR family transcriptional regulator n=1 Tax=Cytobacillus horneckiae TaxID=549687 RepID=UPI003D9A22EF
MARPLNFDPTVKLQEVMMLFWKKGYNGTSLADLMQVTGLSKSSLYQTFGNKHHLFLSAFEMYHQKRLSQLKEILSSEDTALNAIEKLLHFTIAEDNEVNVPYGCMTCNEAVEFGPHDIKMSRLLEEEFQKVEAEFVKVIKRGQIDGSITKDVDEILLARFLTVTIQGMHVMIRARSNKNRLQDTLTVVKRTLKK